MGCCQAAERQHPWSSAPACCPFLCNNCYSCWVLPKLIACHLPACCDLVLLYFVKHYEIAPNHARFRRVGGQSWGIVIHVVSAVFQHQTAQRPPCEYHARQKCTRVRCGRGIWLRSSLRLLPVAKGKDDIKQLVWHSIYLQKLFTVEQHSCFSQLVTDVMWQRQDGWNNKGHFWRRCPRVTVFCSVTTTCFAFCKQLVDLML